MPNTRFLAALLVSASFALIAFEAHAASESYEKAISAIRQGRAPAVYNQLKPQLGAQAGNPEFDTAFGLAALDTGRTLEAVSAFERVLAVQPDNLAIRTELARAYERMGDLEASKRELETVSMQDQTPGPVKDNLSQYASVLDEKLSGGPTTVTGEVYATLGYDSNVNSATSATSLVIPAFAALGPARLSGGAVAREDAFGEIGGNVTIRHPLAIDKVAFGTISASGRKLLEEDDYDQVNLNGQGGIQYKTPDHGDFIVGASLGNMWFDEDTYSTDIGAFGQWRKILQNDSTLGVYTNYTFVDYDDDTEDRDAHRVILGTNLGKRFASVAYAPYVFGGL